MPLLTLVVPAYNAAGHLGRCVRTLTGASDVEIIIVDDGSTDATAEVAAEFAAAHPQITVIRQQNAGHGGAVNAGVDAATGVYLKVVDSDDWLNPAALDTLVATLRELTRVAEGPDVVVTNFVYERVGRHRKTAVRYRRALPRGRVIGWEHTRRFGPRQYFMMHSLAYRTDLLRTSGLRLPERTFYVDNLFVMVPLNQARRLYYLDVDLYRYFIGREDQSVNEAVMIRRMDQYLRVNRLLVAEVPDKNHVPPALYRYLVHHVATVCAVTSVMLLRAGTEEALQLRADFWREVRRNPQLHRRLRRHPVASVSSLPGRWGGRFSIVAYRVARRLIGFN
ncbi:glycosyltransferase family 2 protein [Bogoriella caseilytica]|uniref:Glycosyltransferase involved in cell wall biosynthesis n=1 Tax=Bogoriella caseilytica TaxID=56055 RepID=A0A3N2BF72_9MICO|nr:glycosyltransferase [Bogoriella caseilytica]ROR73906.1 glycosyltransferase involved in cell wall biosynthesis [Bogoriella caseilytica]